MNLCRSLALQLSDLALKGSVLSGTRLPDLIQIFAQFAVLPQENEREKGGNDRQDCEEHKNQLSHGLWHPWECVILCFNVRTATGANLALSFCAARASKLRPCKTSKVNNLAALLPPNKAFKGSRNFCVENIPLAVRNERRVPGGLRDAALQGVLARWQRLDCGTTLGRKPGAKSHSHRAAIASPESFQSNSHPPASQIR